MPDNDIEVLKVTVEEVEVKEEKEKKEEHRPQNEMEEVEKPQAVKVKEEKEENEVKVSNENIKTIEFQQCHKLFLPPSQKSSTCHSPACTRTKKMRQYVRFCNKI